MAQTIADLKAETLRSIGGRRDYGVVGDSLNGLTDADSTELPAALSTAFEHNGPVLVDAVTARQELVLPPKTTREQAYRFNLFMIKAVLDGRATELVDLARTNLLWIERELVSGGR